MWRFATGPGFSTPASAKGRATARESFKIITFDSLAEGLGGKHEVSTGSRHNQFIDILTDEMTDPALYSWVEPTQLRVSKVLHDKLKNGPRSNHFVFDDGKEVETLTRAARLVRVRPGLAKADKLTSLKTSGRTAPRSVRMSCRPCGNGSG